MKNKKAQLHMTETIAVIFISFILVVFGMIFYAQYQKVAFKEKQEEILSTRAVQTTLRALYLSELICSQGEAEPEDNCIDLIKAEAVQAIFQKYLSNYYFHLFGYGRLTLHEVYPQEKELVLYEKRRVENLANESTFMMVSLRDDRLSVGTEPSYAYGYLLVEVYS